VRSPRRPSQTIQRRRPVRRTLLISPFGVGAITDFRNDEALICAGLDAWFVETGHPPEELKIREERLQQRLGVEFFVRPPDFSPDEGGSRVTVPYVRFPLWHYCPRCFRMLKSTLFGDQPRCTTASCASGKFARRLIPVRIVAVCERGHMEDFPFEAWIGCQEADKTRCELSFKAGRSSASLAGIKIDCGRCGKGRSLAQAFQDDAMRNVGAQCCSGRPWLGEAYGSAVCDKDLRVVQRGGSNVYFPFVASSIYIPPPDVNCSAAVKAVLGNEKIWSGIKSGRVNGRINSNVIAAVAVMQGVDAAELEQAAQSRLDAESGPPVVVDTEERFRRQEHNVLKSGLQDARAELLVETIPAERYGWLQEFVETVGLVRKLRETRALAAFSRLNPVTSAGDPNAQALSLERRSWRPAIEVRGEGIFLELKADRIAVWAAANAAVIGGRVGTLLQDHALRRRQRGLEPRPIDARFIMLHTLAHVLIKELTFTCGYGSASLRERLYCSIDEPDQPMNGILIYTASGDSEGTLGGLVRQGAPGTLEKTILAALDRARWCSNDPVCMESPARGAQSSNLAACHGCVLLPETSCEEGNRLLDRALLVGTIANATLGLFGGVLD
jgi:Domain of unknown function (DUF1998)